MKPGETKTVNITLTANQNSPSAVVRVAPEIAPYVTASPTTIGQLTAGQSVQVTLAFGVKIDAVPLTATGTLQLRSVDESGNAIAQPLPIDVKIVWLPASGSIVENITGKYTFNAPTGWSTIDGLITTSSEILLPPGKSPNLNNEYVGDIFIDVYPNSGVLDFSDFYQTIRKVNFFSSSAKQTRFTINGLDAIRFDDVGGMIPSTVVALKLSDRYVEITDYNSAHQTDGIFNSIVSSVVPAPVGLNVIWPQYTGRTLGISFSFPPSLAASSSGGTVVLFLRGLTS